MTNTYMSDEFMNLVKHINKVSYELAHEPSLSAEAKEMLMELWRQTCYAEGFEY